MTDDTSPTPADAPAVPTDTPDRLRVAAADEPVRLPSWMGATGTEQELTGAEHRRLTWARHRGKLVVAFLAAVALLLVVLVIVVGADVVRQIR
ncbi:hypothetical protein [Micromonospora coxensis]|uniref:Uncharacterized protein n=1 Tax=Micromonospora coxensis TaxID=356852 RepID=A0A1C5JJQ2_9ACTN|nr:hypothetical protein [Micromonospora coxensis]SCG70541.1 hypothetical protein GA0070614_4705 [Micromonospora coxensis]